MKQKAKAVFVVLNDKGLHTRPSTELVKCAANFNAQIHLSYRNYVVNAKSLLGILMLAALSMIGHTNIHQMNALKNILAACINALAAAYFAWVGLVIWSIAVTMAVGAILGGMAGTELARRIGQTAVRRVIVVIGFAMALTLMFRL